MAAQSLFAVNIDPQRQVDRLKAFAFQRGPSAGWRFGASDFDRLADPPTPPGDGWHFVGLGAHLGSIGQTMAEAWNFACTRQQASDLWAGEVDWDRRNLRALVPSTFQKGTIDWFVLNVRAHWNPNEDRQIKEVRGPRSACAQALWMAGQNPSWVRAMNGTTVPQAALAGYEVALDGNRWDRVPCLYWRPDTQEICLRAIWCVSVLARCAVPEVSPT
jgi:hypothetical protein